jgi:hypothetical protein
MADAVVTPLSVCDADAESKFTRFPAGLIDQTNRKELLVMTQANDSPQAQSPQQTPIEPPEVAQQSAQVSGQITQLQEQIANLTQIQAYILQGQFLSEYHGAESAEALLYALSPSMQGSLSLNPPATVTELDDAKKAGS